MSGETSRMSYSRVSFTIPSFSFSFPSAPSAPSFCFFLFFAPSSSPLLNLLFLPRGKFWKFLFLFFFFLFSFFFFLFFFFLFSFFLSLFPCPFTSFPSFLLLSRPFPSLSPSYPLSFFIFFFFLESKEEGCRGKESHKGSLTTSQK